MLRNTVRAAHILSKQCQDYVGGSGLKYSFQKLIQHRPETGSVWIAQAESRQYILKDVPKSYYDNFTADIWPPLRRHPHPNIRLPCDTVPVKHVLIYDYLSHDLLELARENVNTHSRRPILKKVLLGLADMHDHDIMHHDLKPDNIVVQCDRDTDGNAVIADVRITDIENAVLLVPGETISGILAGNDNWRSPEAHLRAKLSTPTDMFSFGVMCIYVMLGRVIFARDEDMKHHESYGNEPTVIRLYRRTCFFGDEVGVEGLCRHCSSDEQLCLLVRTVWEERNEPYITWKHFSTRPEVKDEEFKDVVLKLMCLDSAGRLTANEALQHPWFASV